MQIKKCDSWKSGNFRQKYLGKVLPIEVKSGKDYGQHRALVNIMDCREYILPEALILCNDNLTR